jgi:hypothetical protein
MLGNQDYVTVYVTKPLGQDTEMSCIAVALEMMPDLPAYPKDPQSSALYTISDGDWTDLEACAREASALEAHALEACARELPGSCPGQRGPRIAGCTSCARPLRF